MVAMVAHGGENVPAARKKIKRRRAATGASGVRGRWQWPGGTVVQRSLAACKAVGRSLALLRLLGRVQAQHRTRGKLGRSGGLLRPTSWSTAVCYVLRGGNAAAIATRFG